MKQLINRMDWQTAFMLVGQVATKQASVSVGMKSLGVSRAHLHRLVRRWFEWQEKPPAREWLSATRRREGKPLPEKAAAFLRREIAYLTDESLLFRGHVNFAVLSDRCRELFGQRLSRGRIRRWAMREGLFKPEAHSTAKALKRFDVGAVGELFQHDSSPHLWVPAMKMRTVLILTIDDHSRKIVGALLVPHDTAFHHLTVLRSTVETYGRPVAYYTDNAQIFQTHTDVHAQFARALWDLKIEPRLTGKAQPQAKGKVEKRFDYLQRRIPYLCERYHVKSLTAANQLLRKQVEYFNQCHVHAETKETPNQRWKRALQEGRCHLRPLAAKATDLDLIFGLHYRRRLKKDGSFVFQGCRFESSHGPRYGEVNLVLHPPFGQRNFTRLSALWKGASLGQWILPAGSVTWRRL